MAQQRQLAAEERLVGLSEQFERWRRVRAKRSPIPAHLWDQAVCLARQLGVHRVKAALRLNYESLRQRVARSGGTSAAAAGGFVELSGEQVLAARAGTGPVVEVAAAHGVRLTVRLEAGSDLDIAGLVEIFRRQPT